MTRLSALALVLVASLAPASPAHAEEDRELGLRLLGVLEAYRDLGVTLDRADYEAPKLDEGSSRYLDDFSPPPQGHTLRGALLAQQRNKALIDERPQGSRAWIYEKNRQTWARIFRAVKARLDASIRARYDAHDDLFYSYYTIRTYDDLRKEAERVRAELGPLTKIELAAVGRSKKEETAALRPSSEQAGRTFAGQWQTTWSGGGTAMILEVSGRTVSGSYTYKGGTIQGTLSEDGRTLQATWHQTENGGRGKLWFRLADDGMSFRGTFGVGPGANSSYWNGTRK
ncbi:MAG: hypothetical protein AB7T63_07385 [Planctomycetota bacterium]